MNEFIESIISGLENDNACVFSYDVGADQICIILNVLLYKQGCYGILNFDSAIKKPTDMKFYMCGDEIIAFSSRGVKEALHEVCMEKGIPKLLFDEAFLFIETKSPLNLILTNAYFIEMLGFQIQKVFDALIVIQEKQKQIKELEDRLIRWGAITTQESENLIKKESDQAPGKV